MKIAILSGKGGTGKTTVTINLAFFLKKCTIIDTDVEEPNVHLFFNMKNLKTKAVTVKVPVINHKICNLCGKCSDFCKYSSLFNTKKSIIIFEESCHSCQGCELVCELGAIQFKERKIGKIISGNYNDIDISYGELNISELSGVKIIEKLNEKTKKEDMLLIDCPPGTSCSTVAAVSNSDFAVVVAEPTPFGVSDLKMVIEMLNKLNKKYGVVVNKAGLGNREIYKYLFDNKIPLLEEIPFNEEISKFSSDGIIFLEKSDRYLQKFKNLYKNIEEKLYESR